MRGHKANFRGHASSQLYISGRGGGGGGGGGVHRGKKSESVISQLRALATRTPSLGHCGQGALELCLLPITKCFFLMTLAFLDISSKKMCL